MDPFIGEIRMLGFNFPPRGWATCDGQLLSIAQNSALFSLLGTFYGGNGQTTFALPDLRGRFPNHQGAGPGLPTRTLGEVGGAASMTITTPQMPAHVHPVTPLASSGLATQSAPGGAVLAAGLGSKEARYANEAGDVAMTSFNSGLAGGGQPVSIVNPFLTISFCIALEGIYPSRN
ncbi:MAG: tail fiber protein [Archangium sp.]|nr:tail fiber protein [Archangium sp.]MDP3151687.1 tail fiber protein [Archangium sp.]MDP3573205.1 tail fiber protein [Archangium sp.]